ncbi:ankyrin repeat domain-containing protein 6-like [Centruroides vittatus]|uniref:ankyrin repeat domain-containing protein 6-like n=1 Tax=Centruroides vittatus TaxID=120091 RepID=UPI003510B10C
MLRSFRLPKFRQRNRSSNDFCEEGESLHSAASTGNVDRIRELLDFGVRVNVINEHGNTALHQAAWNGFSQTIEILCKKGADVYAKNKAGFSALHLTCQNGHNQSCRILLLAGCKPDIKNSYGDTPLHTAARYGHAGVARILISAHCNINETNKNGDTALHISVAMGRKKLSQIFLNAGCSQFIKNKQKEKPLDIARRKKYTEIEHILLRHIRERNLQGRLGNLQGRFSEASQGSRDSTDNAEQFWKENKWNFERSDMEYQRYKKQQSPYGCHMFPNPDVFPPIKLNTLPSEPLMKGEQYYIDLAGNIKKGPTGFGHNCYCKPLIKRVEKILEAG